MKTLTVSASVLLGATILVAPVHAAPQEGGAETKQTISKTARRAAGEAKVLYQGTPHFVSIRETPITYATNAPEPVLHVGDVFYALFTYFNPIARSTQNMWLVSARAQGPWVPAQSVPRVIGAIVCSQLSSDPLNPYQLCALPWTSPLIYAVWKPSSI
jgi:hypothetical protein